MDAFSVNSIMADWKCDFEDDAYFEALGGRRICLSDLTKKDTTTVWMLVGGAVTQ